MRPHLLALFAGGAAVVVLAAASTVAVAALDRRTSSATCSAPALGGTVAHVELTNMGGNGMGSGGMGGGGMGGTMRVLSDTGSVPAGTVSFVVTNTGSIAHELLVLPLAGIGQTGDRAIGPDNRIDEASSLGEASSTCGGGPGDGIDAGTVGWVTMTLAPGRYELLCNLAGHYSAGMYAELTVT